MIRQIYDGLLIAIFGSSLACGTPQAPSPSLYPVGWIKVDAFYREEGQRTVASAVPCDVGTRVRADLITTSGPRASGFELTVTSHGRTKRLDIPMEPHSRLPENRAKDGVQSSIRMRTELVVPSDAVAVDLTTSILLQREIGTVPDGRGARKRLGYHVSFLAAGARKAKPSASK